MLSITLSYYYHEYLCIKVHLLQALKQWSTMKAREAQCDALEHSITLKQRLVAEWKQYHYNEPKPIKGYH